MVSAERAVTWRELEERGVRPRPRLPRPRARARRPGRLADAEPDRPRRPLPRLLQGRPGRHAAQLPLHAPRDRPRAGGERGPGVARPRRARRGRGAPASWPASSPLGTIAYGEAERCRGTRPTASRTLVETDAARATSCRRRRDPADPAAIFFTSGSTGPGQGRHPHARDAALDDRQRDRRLRAERRGRLPARLLDVAHRLLPLGAQRRSRSAAGWSSPAPSTPTSCCRCCASTSRPCWR